MNSWLPQILFKQNTDFVHILFTNIVNWLLNLHGKKKSLIPAKTLTEPINLMALLSAPNPNANFACNNQRQQLTALWSNGIQVSSEWQYSTPMMLGDPVGAAIIFRVSVPLLITTLLKCIMCAHWRPSSWWRSRRPPSLPMPKKSTDFDNPL